MRKAVAFVFVAALLCGATAVTLADYYATKADYRAGKLTDGYPVAPRGGGGQDDCSSPPVIADLDYSAANDTTSAASDVDDIPMACNGNYSIVAGPDHIYTFTAAVANQLTFTVTTTDDDYDTSIYTTSLCGDGNTCVTGAASDDCFARSSGGNPCGAVSERGQAPSPNTRFGRKTRNERRSQFPFRDSPTLRCRTWFSQDFSIFRRII